MPDISRHDRIARIRPPQRQAPLSSAMHSCVITAQRSAGFYIAIGPAGQWFRQEPRKYRLDVSGFSQGAYGLHARRQAPLIVGKCC
jgi:hypothetical protein